MAKGSRNSIIFTRDDATMRQGAEPAMPTAEHATIPVSANAKAPSRLRVVKLDRPPAAVIDVAGHAVRVVVWSWPEWIEARSSVDAVGIVRDGVGAVTFEPVT